MSPAPWRTTGATVAEKKGMCSEPALQRLHPHDFVPALFSTGEYIQAVCAMRHCLNVEVWLVPDHAGLFDAALGIELDELDAMPSSA
jgi:hypothetical protein